MGDEGLPFAPYTEIIRTLIAEDGVAQVAAMAGRTAADLARLVPALGAEDVAREKEVWAQTRLYEALFDLLRHYAERAPLVIELEDMHWADADTFAATSFILRFAARKIRRHVTQVGDVRHAVQRYVSFF